MKRIAVQITYQIIFETAFHPGAGYRRGLLQNTVTRDARGDLYLPGSTLKGKVRTHCEDLAQLFQIPTCQPPAPERMCQDQAPCAVCRLFGSPFAPGDLYFDNACLHSDQKKAYSSWHRGERKGAYQTWERTQVFLDRRLGRSGEHLLFHGEYGVPGLTFEGAISGSPLLTPVPEDSRLYYEIILLVAGLLSLDKIGREKSRGAGWCRTIIEKVCIDQQVLSAEDILSLPEYLIDLAG